MVFLLVASVILAYLLGSINFAVIFAKLFLKKDVRELGSGNAGTTNVMRTAGFLPGALTFICDALKGFVACFIGKAVFDYAFNIGIEWAFPIYGAYLCGVACMLGHVFPMFFHFKGGKGVATSVGIYLVCCPPAILIGLAVFALSLLIFKIVSVSSLLAALVVVVLSFVFYSESAPILIPMLLSVSMGAIVFLKHSTNIKRLLKGEEKKISLGGKKNG